MLENKDSKSSRLNKQVNIIIPILFGWLLASHFLPIDSYWYEKSILFLAIVAITLPFAIYEYLQHLSIYLKFLTFAVIFKLYFDLDYYKLELNTKDLLSNTLCAFLLIQPPTRFIFKYIVKREPVVDRPPPSFIDFIYMATLIGLTVLVFQLT